MTEADGLSDRVQAMTMSERERETANVIRIGWCPGCRRRARLVDGACVQCRDRFGAGCGVLMTCIRVDREFARFVFSRVPEENREAFLEMFGDPHACEG